MYHYTLYKNKLKLTVHLWSFQKRVCLIYIVVGVAFQNVFYVETHQNNIFFNFKIYFDINTLKK